MAEYAGYVASPPINYGEISDGLVSNIIAIDQAKREQDRKTQESFDKYFDENVKTIKDFEYSKSPTFNSKVVPLADQYKKVIYNAKKTGSKQQVGLVTSNAKTSINNINQAMKSISDNVGIIEKTTLEGKNSAMGNVYSDYYADIVSPNNGEFTVLDDGTTAYTLYNKDGKIESTNSMFDPATLTKPAPFLDAPVDYEKNLTDWVASIGTVQDEQGRITTVSPALNPAFGNAKQTKIAELTSTPRNAARFLSSVAGYKGFKNEESRQELIASGVPKEKLIQVSLVDGIPQPILTDTQKKAAKAIAAQQIDQRVGIKKMEDEEPRDPFAYYDYKKQQEDAAKMAPKIKAVKNAEAIYNAFRTAGEAGKMGQIPEFSPLKEAGRLKGWTNLSVSNVGGEVVVYGKAKGAKKSSDLKELARLSSPGEVYAFLTGKENIIDAKSDFDVTKDYMQYNQPSEPEKQQENVVTLSQIKSLSTQQRGGLNEQEYAAFLKSQGYTVK
jgi:hypothetical protein